MAIARKTILDKKSDVVVGVAYDIKGLEKVWRNGRKNIKKALEIQKYYYDKRHSSGQIFKVVDKVLRRTDRKALVPGTLKKDQKVALR